MAQTDSESFSVDIEVVAPEPATASPAVFVEAAEQLLPYYDCSRWVVGFSGGIDSTALLHWLHCHFPSSPPLAAIHVHHGLCGEADQWAAHCQRFCRQQKIPLHVVKVTVPPAPGGVEARARQVRYEAFTEQLGDKDLLLLAHHREDQLETFFLRLLHGASVTGLKGIPNTRAVGKARLLRPLLEVSRDEIERYVHQYDLPWVHDASNDHLGPDRNFVRQQIFATFDQRWSQWRRVVGSSIVAVEENATLAEELATLDIQRADPLSGREGSSLSLPVLLALSPARQKNVLYYWLKSMCSKQPSSASLANLITSVLKARPDASAVFRWCGVELRRYQQRLYALKVTQAIHSEAEYYWQPTAPLTLPNNGSLTATVVKGYGIRYQPEQPLTVRYRNGTQYCQPHGRASNATLKKLFQEYRISPWLRPRVPLVYVADELVAVGDIWVCENFVPAAEEPGLSLHWDYSLDPFCPS